MFGIGMQELVIIFVVALIFIGPQKLPDVARSLAKGLREFRRASDDLRQTIMIDLDDDQPIRHRPPPRFPEPAVTVAAKGDDHGAPSSDPDFADPSDAPPSDGVEQDAADDVSIPGSLAAPEGTIARGASSSESENVKSSASLADVDADVDADDHSGLPFAPSSDALDVAMAKAQSDADKRAQALADAKGQADEVEAS